MKDKIKAVFTFDFYVEGEYLSNHSIELSEEEKDEQRAVALRRYQHDRYSFLRYVYMCQV